MDSIFASVFLGWTNPTGDFRQVFLLRARSGAKIKLSLFSFMDNQSISYVSAGILVSVAIFVAFKARQVCTIENHIQELDLERLKQKTESILERLWVDTQGNAKLPGGLTFQDIVEKAFLIDESTREQIIGLNKIYLDLASNGASSSYFVYILDVYAIL